MKYNVEFFTPKEFKCKCCGKGEPAAALVLALDFLRRAWSGPVIVNSGCRCGVHNCEVGGVMNSRHMIGCAADIRPRDLEFIAPFKSLASNMFGRLSGWELKFYQRFVHVAVPREEAADVWNGSPINITMH